MSDHCRSGLRPRRQARRLQRRRPALHKAADRRRHGPPGQRTIDRHAGRHRRRTPHAAGSRRFPGTHPGESQRTPEAALRHAGRLRECFQQHGHPVRPEKHVEECGSLRRRDTLPAVDGGRARRPLPRSGGVRRAQDRPAAADRRRNRGSRTTSAVVPRPRGRAQTAQRTDHRRRAFPAGPFGTAARIRRQRPPAGAH